MQYSASPVCLSTRVAVLCIMIPMGRLWLALQMVVVCMMWLISSFTLSTVLFLRWRILRMWIQKWPFSHAAQRSIPIFSDSRIAPHEYRDTIQGSLNIYFHDLKPPFLKCPSFRPKYWCSQEVGQVLIHDARRSLTGVQYQPHACLLSGCAETWVFLSEWNNRLPQICSSVFFHDFSSYPHLKKNRAE